MQSSHPLKILLLSWNFPPVLGGIEYVAGHLFKGLSAWGHEIRVITAGSPTAPPQDGVLRASKTGLRAFLMHAWREGVRQCRQFRPDVLLCGTLVPGPVAYILSRWFRIPYVVLAHGSDILHRGWLYQKVARWVLKHAAMVTANSQLTAELLVQAGLPREKVAVIHPGVDVAPFLKMTRQDGYTAHPEWKNRRILLYVGRLIKRKGIHTFIEHVMPDLIQVMPDLLLIVVGDDAKASLVHSERMKDALARSVESMGLRDHVLLAGAMCGDTLLKLYFRADVFILPCLELPGDIEGFGIVFLEAALAGVPSVATRTGGIPEAVVDGETGLLVAPGDYAAMRAAILRLIQDRALHDRLAETGARRAREQFGWDVISRKYAQVLRDASATSTAKAPTA